MNDQDFSHQTVWVIGASSGIGLALARELSMRGARLALSSRREDELEKLRLELGEQHKTLAFDVTDANAAFGAAQSIQAAFGKIDRVVHLAAAYAPMKMDALDIVGVRGIVNANLIGAFNLVHGVLPILKSQKTKGQLALCASVAGYFGLPNGQPYSATKAAVINLAESLQAECKDEIDIKLICPGFVRTPLTDKNDFRMPMIIEPGQAAKEIADGLLSDRFEIHFPKRFTLLLKVLRLLPYALSLRLTRGLQT